MKTARSHPRKRKVSLRSQESGYFAGTYTKAEIREDNRLAKASVIRPPKDLESTGKDPKPGEIRSMNEKQTPRQSLPKQIAECGGLA